MGRCGSARAPRLRPRRRGSGVRLAVGQRLVGAAPHRGADVSVGGGRGHRPDHPGHRRITAGAAPAGADRAGSRLHRSVVARAVGRGGRRGLPGTVRGGIRRLGGAVGPTVRAPGRHRRAVAPALEHQGAQLISRFGAALRRHPGRHHAVQRARPAGVAGRRHHRRPGPRRPAIRRVAPVSPYAARLSVRPGRGPRRRSARRPCRRRRHARAVRHRAGNRRCRRRPCRARSLHHSDIWIRHRRRRADPDLRDRNARCRRRSAGGLHRRRRAASGLPDRRPGPDGFIEQLHQLRTVNEALR
jgi:hypothetical protein